MKTPNHKMRFNLDGLKALKEALPTDDIVKVGVLRSDNSREDEDGGVLGNAEVGLIQEIGSISRNIPARSWLRMPIETRQKELIKFMQSPKAQGLAEDLQFEKLLQLLGIKAEAIIHEAFQTGGFGKWPANAPATIAAKGSSKPLIDTRQLDTAVSSEVAKDV